MKHLLWTLLTLLPPAWAQPVTTPVYWPDKGGPGRDSIVPAAEASRLPPSWTEAQHLQWKTPLEGGDLIWFTSATTDGTKQYVDCIQRHTGKLLHHQLLFENTAPEELGNPINNYAAPSPVLEADALYVHFGTYGTACLDPATAKVKWQRRDIQVKHYRGPGASPALYQHLLILALDGTDQQFLIALDKKTGTTVWKTPRSTDYGDIDAATGKPKRDGDLRKAYHTPCFVQVGSQTQLISVGSRAAFGYDPLSGKELWTIKHTGFNAAPRVLATDQALAFSSGAEGAHLIGVRLDDKMRGDITASHLLWDRPKRNCSEASPVLIDGKIYQITRGGIISCIDIATGQDHWEERLQGQYLQGPLAIQDRLYFANDRGQIHAIRAADKYELLSTSQLSGGADDACTAGMAVADGALYIRTRTHLVKIANPSPQ
jgi:outer membrane protein assembly factor BamB